MNISLFTLKWNCKPCSTPLINDVSDNNRNNDLNVMCGPGCGGGGGGGGG